MSIKRPHVIVITINECTNEIIMDDPCIISSRCHSILKMYTFEFRAKQRRNINAILHCSIVEKLSSTSISWMLAANDDSVMEIVCRSFNKKSLVTGDIGEIYSNIEKSIISSGMRVSKRPQESLRCDLREQLFQNC